MNEALYSTRNCFQQRVLALTVWAALALSVTAQPVPGKGAAAPAKSTLPANARSEEVKFSGQGLTLAGTLLLPKLEAGKRAPAILLVGGAGAATRDGASLNQIPHTLYRELAEHFVGQGWVVLRYDKRCAGTGACQPKTNFDLLVDDARGALAFLRKRAEVEPAQVFLLGHGEGGMVSSVVASNDETLAGLIMVAAPGRTLNKVLREQMLFRMKEAGRKEADMVAQLARFDRLVRAITTGMAEELRAGLDPKNPDDAMLLMVIGQADFMIPLFINDPLQIANSIKAPVLILQGEKDVEMSVKDAQYLNEAFHRAQHPDHTLRLLPDVDHLLKANKGAASTAIYTTTRPVEAGVLALLTEWSQKRLK
jgi:pimeloyl-ACP methyl ester carboxylesterase